MISRIIKDKVCVIHRSRRLRWITQTEALIILDIMRKPNSIIVLLYIQNQMRISSKPFCLGFKNMFGGFIKQTVDRARAWELQRAITLFWTDTENYPTCFDQSRSKNKI